MSETPDEFDLISEDWLRDVGFKWHQFDRQPNKQWLLWLGEAMGGSSSFEDIGIEVASGAWCRATGLEDEWFCWLRGDSAGRYHRFIHIRHVRLQRDIVRLVEALTGLPWRPENHFYGSVRTPEQAEWLRREQERLDRRGQWPTWGEAEKDDTRGRALPEHINVAIKSGGAR